MTLTPREAKLAVEALQHANGPDGLAMGNDQARRALIEKLQPLARRAELSNPDRKGNSADR